MVKNRIGISALLFVMLSAGSVDARQSVRTLLVVPSRYTIVQLAFDMAKIRDVDLVAYDPDAERDAPAMHMWNAALREWTRISLEDYDKGSLFRVRPDRIMIIGDDDSLPAGLIEASAWSSERTHVPTLKIVTLVNSLNGMFNFKSREWKWLAKRYKLELVDLNADRRRSGRYGRLASRNKSTEVVPVPTVDKSHSVKPVPVKDPDRKPLPKVDTGLKKEPRSVKLVPKPVATPDKVEDDILSEDK